MKKTLNLLAALIFSTISLTSCNKNDGYDDSWYQKELERIDSINKLQAPILQEYADEHLGKNNTLDTATGIRFIMIEEAPGNSFNYINSIGLLNRFMTSVKYTGRLVPTGNIFDSSDEEKTFTSDGIIDAWRFAFYPKSVEVNGIIREIGGITPHGLHKGSKIRFVAPSTLCYDRQSIKDKEGNEIIPANTPLDFTIKVVDILH